MQTFLLGLTPTESTDYSLWKATKKIKQVKKPSPPLRISQRTWARRNAEKAHAFTVHLAKVFQLHLSENEPDEEEALIQLLQSTLTNSTIPKELKFKEVFNSLNPKKSLGYDHITDTILKELPTIGIKYLTQLFNAVLLKGYFLAEWKVAQIILILKPGKPPNEL
jgi:hypothetical protein